MRLSVQVFDGTGAADLAPAAQEWHADDHSADDEGVTLYRIQGFDTTTALQILQDHVSYFGPKVISVCIYRNRDHVDMYDDRRVTAVRKTVCAGGSINFNVDWEHA